MTEDVLNGGNRLSPLGTALEEINRKCTRCGNCRRDCAFLRKHGLPGDLADAYDSGTDYGRLFPFECSLCAHCAAVCPEGLKPADLFLELRREKMRRDPSVYPGHRGFLAYEKRGASPLFSHYAIPENCRAVFFPGCALAGTRSERTLQLYNHLKQFIPSLGVVLDCCMKISHDLGREDYFRIKFGAMRDFLVRKGVRQVIVACPNCFRVFAAYGGELDVASVYEILDRHPLPLDIKVEGKVTVHDPCPLRFSPTVHKAVRSLIVRQGLTIEEMSHSREKTICCGEGGFVSSLSPELAGNWKELRRDEAAGRNMITYCAGCTTQLHGLAPLSHILDMLFDPRSAMAGKAKPAMPPVTYLKRLKLKWTLKRLIKVPEAREREGEKSVRGRKIALKRILLPGFLVAAVIAFRYAGAVQYLEPETLRHWINGYGAQAPLIYVLIYALAPTLMLPALPLTIAGGVLFGPFWGVVYAITGSTIGACAAFLVARYTARGWVDVKLTDHRWRRLDRSVEEQGWKIVAITRLIPLFPFNLLNYAFGLTRIRFTHYAAATFVFMLPACIAFIVFSSSLPDLLKGRISFSFVTGLIMLALVGAIPLIYRRFRKTKASPVDIFSDGSSISTDIDKE